MAKAVLFLLLPCDPRHGQDLPQPPEADPPPQPHLVTQQAKTRRFVITARRGRNRAFRRSLLEKG